MKRKMILADRDTIFSERLSQALNNRAEFPWTVTPVSSREEYIELSSDSQYDSVLVSREIFGDEEIYPFTVLFVESRDEEISEQNTVFKYQTVSGISERLTEIDRKRVTDNVPAVVEESEIIFEEMKVRKILHDEVMQRLDLRNQISDIELEQLIGDVIQEKKEELKIPDEMAEWFLKIVYAALRRQDILSIAMDDENVTEIMVNGGNKIFVERGGGLESFDQNFTSSEKPMDIVQQIAAGVNRRVNEASPMVDARLPDGSRVNIVLPPVALDGPSITIRRFRKDPIHMEDLIHWGAITEEAATFLKVMVECGYNIFISGGTGAGKTTFLGALSEYIPKDERVITIEDSAELKITHIDNLVRLESRPANLEGEYEVTIRDLIRNSLRMRPDRIIVGEIRSAEALDMLQAMNTGHDGSISTGHANSARDMISRIETMVLMGMDLPIPAIRSQIATGIDIMIHLTRLRDKSRRVAGIYEVVGLKEGEVQLQTLFEFVEIGESEGKVQGHLENTGHSLTHCKKLNDKGKQIQVAGYETRGNL